MANLSNLTSKILREAEERKENILKAANEEKNKILSKRNKEISELEAEMVEKAIREAATRKERVISGAELQARNTRLEAKQEIINEVFQMSIESLCSLENEEYKNFIKYSILSLGIAGNEKLILNSKGKELVDDTLLEEINKELLSSGKKGELVISEVEGNFAGGFVLEKDGIEVNNTFEALVSSLREELEFVVAKELFN